MRRLPTANKYILSCPQHAMLRDESTSHSSQSCVCFAEDWLQCRHFGLLGSVSAGFSSMAYLMLITGVCCQKGLH